MASDDAEIERLYARTKAMIGEWGRWPPRPPHEAIAMLGQHAREGRYTRDATITTLAIFSVCAARDNAWPEFSPAQLAAHLDQIPDMKDALWAAKDIYESELAN